MEIENTFNYQRFWLCIDGYKLKKTFENTKGVIRSRFSKNDRHVTIRWPNKKAKTLISESRDDTGCDMEKQHIFYKFFHKRVVRTKCGIYVFIIPSPTKLRRDIVTLRPSFFPAFLPSVRPSFRNLLVNTLESTSFNWFWSELVHTLQSLEPYWFSRS